MFPLFTDMTKNLMRSAVLGAIAVAPMVAILPSGNAQAAVLVPTSGLTDAGFNQLISSGDFTEKFVTSARIGDAGAATYEMGLLRPNQSVAGQKQYQWNSGTAVDFSLEYDGALVKYKLGDEIISSMEFTGDASDLFLRTRSATNSTSLFSNLKLQDGSGTLAIADLTSSGNGDVDYLRLGKLQGAFKLSGQTTMSWTGARPTNSSLIAQVKVGNSKAVPEPANVAALGLFGLLATVIRQRRG
jgi:hypothetical protein